MRSISASEVHDVEKCAWHRARVAWSPARASAASTRFRRHGAVDTIQRTGSHGSDVGHEGHLTGERRRRTGPDVERSAQQKAHDEQRVRVLLELESAKRRSAVLARIAGAALLVLGAALSSAVYEGMAHRHLYVAELLFFSAWALCAGVVALALGAGGAARLRDVPVGMWLAFAGISAVLALLVMVPLGNWLASLAGFDGL